MDEQLHNCVYSPIKQPVPLSQKAQITIKIVEILLIYQK